MPTVRFQLLCCFVVLRHDRRRVANFNVTAHPTARRTAQQVVEAFPFDESPRFLIRDRDAIYGVDFRERVKHKGIEEVVIAYRSPWQSPYVERLIGSIRRECLNRVIVLNERQRRRAAGITQLAHAQDWTHRKAALVPDRVSVMHSVIAAVCFQFRWSAGCITGTAEPRNSSSVSPIVFSNVQPVCASHGINSVLYS